MEIIKQEIEEWNAKKNSYADNINNDQLYYD